MNIALRNLTLSLFAFAVCVLHVGGQTVRREIPLGKGNIIEVVNRYGRVEINALPDLEKAELLVTAKTPIAESELKVTGSRVELKPSSSKNRIDISLRVPERTRVKITTTDGEVRVSGDLDLVEAVTETGTIAANVPIDDVRYQLLWTESKPRYLSDFELEKVKEKSAGRFSIKGRFPLEGKKKEKDENPEAEPPASAKATTPADGNSGSEPNVDAAKTKIEEQRSKTVTLNFTTARGIVLLNVPPNEVMSDLRERPLTNAAKAIIRSGDTLLTDAIRRASPKYFGEYARTLPPLRREPGMTVVPNPSGSRGSSISTATVTVTDLKNRAVSGLTKEDFEAAESGESREILDIRPATAPVNLVLLLDVSGSVENYVNFIRKAARAFVDTVDRRDRVSIVLFNDDVNEIATFSTDRAKLSQNLDTFDAGGGTAYYDAIAYTLTDTLRSLRGERTAVVVLSDGDDNRSFLPFDSLKGSIEESGALIYPLYVPTSLIAQASNDPNTAVDPLRSRYLSNDLTSKADSEGKQLAEISGGVYYPITQLSQIQTAYEDIVLQLRTAYNVTFRSEFAPTDGKPSPRLNIRTKRPNTFVHIRSVTTQR